ncbi:MAG: hypothetical protein JXK93_07935 [Sphaerochaetaceae bacterium]|nr:hypothetical protein [Sphaerochaetaceae bacterium]
MGVNKKNVRSVIHYDVPYDEAAFLQESGRGGRDGSEAYSVILLSPSDLRLKQNSLLLSFTSGSTCRRERLLAFINSPALECAGCDVCEDSSDRTYLGISPIHSTLSRYGRRFDMVTRKGEKGTIHPFGRYKGFFSSWEPRERISLL